MNCGRARWRWCGRGRRAGFTLVELLAGTTISTVVALAAYAALTGGLSVYDRAGEAAVRMQVVRALADRMTQELEATYFNAQASDLTFEGEEADGTEQGLGSQLTFVTTAARAPLTEVSYLLQAPNPQTGEPGGLYRRASPLLDRQQTDLEYQTESSEEAVLVAPEVVGFEVTYYDPLAVGSSAGLGLRGSLTGAEEWESSWDAASKGYLPQAVKLTFRLGSWQDVEGPEAGVLVADGGPPGRSYTIVAAPAVAEATLAQQLAAEEE